ncbi:MAG TPA: hydroxymethylglutaryl-CoA reductase, degradative [Bacteroidales bacterium]|nr:hydroxymethylglutaryl-CoA reductase, degradative [Bacteroidales bacterium]HRZ21022.1 hydroxymethylglutaryl-CoA reductase, degradative [Bacteroidales bacterium]
MKSMVTGFSKLSKEDKLRYVVSHFQDPDRVYAELTSYWYGNTEVQKKLDEFIENTITNYYFPLGIAPNFMINGKLYMVPMVIEESSVVAAASNSAKFWAERGGFRTRVISTVKTGHVHFIYNGRPETLKASFPGLRRHFFEGTEEMTQNMRKRGGGILDIELVDKTADLPNYYQIRATFETVDSMGANFINSCLEEFARIMKEHMVTCEDLGKNERCCEIIMAILSNYTPECLVEASVECDISDMKGIDPRLSPEKFIWKFKKAVEIARVDEYRATTHNKGIYNGIDAVVLASGNDFRAVEACGHTYAARSGKYSSLTDISVENGHFRYTLTVPLALGTVGGLTSLHPMSKFCLELLGNPNAAELMQIAAAAGLANNFSALRSLVTNGIQIGHMKMHLMNILNYFNATMPEKEDTIQHFKDKVVSFSAVNKYLGQLRGEHHTGVAS